VIGSTKVIALALLALTLTAASATAQKRPDFSGTWVEDESQRKSPYDKKPGDGRVLAIGGPPPPLTIAQTPERLTIEQTRFEQTTRFVHDFDGRENTNRTGAQIHTTRTRWDGSKLVTEGSVFQVTSDGETSWKLKEVRWLTPKGELAVEVTQVDEDNRTGTVLRVFKRR
jgi:hypothetical protein